MTLLLSTLSNNKEATKYLLRTSANSIALNENGLASETTDTGRAPERFQKWYGSGQNQGPKVLIKVLTAFLVFGPSGWGLEGAPSPLPTS